MSPPPQASRRGRSVLIGMGGFTVVSLAGFSVWGFAGGWFYRNVGEAGLYAASTIVFLGLAGLLLHPLIEGRNRIGTLYKTFLPAFVGYAVVWSVCWFALKFGAGEWLGSLAGCFAFAWILQRFFPGATGLSMVVLVLFAAHSAGYFAGSVIYMGMKTPPEFLEVSRSQFSLVKKLLWGLFYGLGFGAGIGYTYHEFQSGRGEKKSEGA